MKNDFLGDSYDLVKRFFAENLPLPLYSHPAYVLDEPTGFRTRYTKLTLIEILDFDVLPSGAYALLLDPDTGISLPDARKRSTVVSIERIIKLNDELKAQPDIIICFDQSYHRNHEEKLSGQMRIKMDELAKHGFHSFYYNSHARFIFMSKKFETLTKVKEHLIALGVPLNCFKR